MAFEIVKAETRTARMIGWFTGICKTVTDLVVGSKLRTKFEAIAVEMEEQDYQFYAAITKAIPTAIYQAFGFTPLSAVKASGTVTFTASPLPVADITIPLGTRIATVASATVSEKVFVTTEEATIPAGQATVSVGVACTKAGTSGNTGANTITVIKTTVSGVTSVTNPLTFDNGSEKETASQRQARFAAYITSLSRATDDAVAYGATTAKLTSGGEITERVVTAKAIDTGPATSDCIIFNGTGTASAALIAEAQKILDGYVDEDGTKVPGYKSGGVVVTVKSATVVPQDVTMTITVKSGYPDAQTQSENAIAAYFSTLGVGDNFIVAEVIKRVMGVPGLINCVPTTPTVDVVAQSTEVFSPGTITVGVA